MEAKNQRILLVDDDPQLLLLSEMVLTKLGYNVISHSNSNHALELFKDLPDQFDLVITDFRMPGRNGAELSKELLEINPDIPIIICAGAGSDIDEEEVKLSGVKFFMRKPFLKNDFIKMVSEAINDKKNNVSDDAIRISDQVQQSATDCTKGLSCLNNEKNDICKIDSCVNDNVHFVKDDNDRYCNYKKNFGSAFYCNCPVRKEIYNKYKK